MALLPSDDPNIMVYDTICHATQVRQSDADTLSRSSDLMIVVGGKQIIKPDSGTDKDFLHLGQLSQLPENVQIFRMVGVNCRTNLRSKAFLALAKPFCQLLFAGWSTEVCRRPTNIMNIALKVGHFCNLLCLF